MVHLMETKLDANRMENVKRRLGFHGCFAIEAVGRKGELALMQRKEASVEIHNYTQMHISAWIVDESEHAK